MASKKEEDVIGEARETLHLVKILDTWNKVLAGIKQSGNKEVVAFLGPTKAGKSTLINCLLGNPLLVKQDKYTEEPHIVCASNSDGPVIGSSGQSETYIPKAYSNLPGTSWSMWDFPGFGDNKGTHQEIANAGAYAAVLEPQESVRFVIVVSIDDIKSDNPMPFFKLLNDVHLICPNIAESVCIVATKIQRGTIVGYLNKAMSGNFSRLCEQNLDIIANAQNLIRCVMLTGNVNDFKAPPIPESGKEMAYNPPNRTNILKMIQGLKGCKLESVPLILSDQARKDILILYMVMYRMFKREINDTCGFFAAHFKNEIENILEHTDSVDDKLAILKYSKSKVTYLLKKTDSLEEFYMAAPRLGMRVEVLSERAKKFAFTEQFQNKYRDSKSEKLRGEDEFLTRIKVLLREASDLHKSYIESLTPNDANTRQSQNRYSGHNVESSLSGDDDLEAMKEALKNYQELNKKIMENV